MTLLGSLKSRGKKEEEEGGCKNVSLSPLWMLLRAGSICREMRESQKSDGGGKGGSREVWRSHSSRLSI